jgi:DHA1 family bicyclomycin/chloramphenicol resistance-like MFS transporter
VNVLLLRRWSSETLFLRALGVQVAFGAFLLAGTWADVLGLYGTLAVLFGFLCCVGVTNPNASALAISPFSRNAGSASALLGFFQLGTGAVISTAIGAATPSDRIPIIAIFGTTAAIGLAILLVGRRRAEESPVTEAADSETSQGGAGESALAAEPVYCQVDGR